MKRTMDQAQRSFSEKLARIPDGKWSEVKYVVERMPGEREAYPIQVNLTKQGDRLIADNYGTHPQVVGPLPFTYSGFAGSILAAFAITTLYEQLFALGGAERQIEYRAEPGTLTCVNYPAAVSGSVANIMTNFAAAQACIARMLACDPELSKDVLAGAAEWPLALIAGTDDRGNYFGSSILDPCGQGGGARSWTDGVNTGGMAVSPLSRLLNVEDVEQWYPIIYLYRRELAESGGHGRFRGGVGLDWAITPYHAGAIEIATNTGGLGLAATNGEGLMGGYPAVAHTLRLTQGTNLSEWFADGRVPTDIEKLKSQSSRALRGKTNSTPLNEGDVFSGTVVGGGGFGDPLDRDLGLLAADLAASYLSLESAHVVYGVVLADDGTIDADATDTRRAALREERRAWPLVAELHPDERAEDPLSATGEPARAVHESVVLRDEGSERILACAKCEQPLGGARSNYKRALALSEEPITIIPGAPDPAEIIDRAIVFRRYCCPGCQTLMTTEVVREGDPIIEDMLLA
jgi:N-methylhydantoinase B